MHINTSLETLRVVLHIRSQKWRYEVLVPHCTGFTACITAAFGFWPQSGSIEAVWCSVQLQSLGSHRLTAVSVGRASGLATCMLQGLGHWDEPCKHGGMKLQRQVLKRCCDGTDPGTDWTGRTL